MGALRQPRLDQPSGKKPPVSEKLDQYGRDPASLSERMRARTDYAKGEGWAPCFFGMWADLPRLSSGAVCYAFIGVVNQLSFGRPRASKSPWHEWTEPISVADLAELCRANVRDIQRQLSELKERGLIAVKTIKQAGAVKYAVSLLLSKWRELEDYAVWKRRQVVEIDSVGDEAETEDEELTAISKDAVHLFKRPASVRPGRATRAAKVSVGVKEFVLENHSPTVDLECTAVITSGRLVVSACVNKGESETKGEHKGNAERHPRRSVPSNGGIQNPPTNGGSTKPARADEIISLFDPLLQKSGSRLISPDLSSLRAACAELGALPHDFLVHFVMVAGGRGSRPISGPRAVASIVKECRLNWEKNSDPRAELLDILAHPNHYTQDALREARQKLAELES